MTASKIFSRLTQHCRPYPNACMVIYTPIYTLLSCLNVQNGLHKILIISISLLILNSLQQMVLLATRSSIRTTGDYTTWNKHVLSVHVTMQIGFIITCACVNLVLLNWLIKEVRYRSFELTRMKCYEMEPEDPTANGVRDQFKSDYGFVLKYRLRRRLFLKYYFFFLSGRLTYNWKVRRWR